MAKIIHDNSISNHSKQSMCSDCKCIIEFTKDDITTAETEKDHTGFSSTFNVVICPKCNNKNVIDDNTLLDVFTFPKANIQFKKVDF